MNYFIQSSQPDRLIESWDEPDINDMFPDVINPQCSDKEITVFDYLQLYNGIYWDWSNVREGRLKLGDRIFIYFSGKRKKSINCLTEIKDIRYITQRPRPLVAYLKKIKWYDDVVTEQLSLGNLRNNGLNTNLQSITDITYNLMLVKYLKKLKVIG